MSHISPKIKNKGFTLIEIIVATTLFAFTSVALTSLFNYTLKINRRAEALRQATQGMRDFVELMAKEVRNGQIDYGVVTGQTVVTSALGQCDIRPSGSSFGATTNGHSSYIAADNRLGLIDTTGNRECFFLGDKNGDYVGSSLHEGKTLVLEKEGGVHQIVNPPNFTIDYLGFYIRPICDPYTSTCQDYSGEAPKIQPFVTIVVRFTTKLPTGEQVPINYQTTITTDKYDVPNNP